MKNVVIKDNTAYVDAFAMEVYLPADYGDKAYRGLNYYEVAGTEVRYFGVGNMRFFDSEKEMTNPESKKVYTLGLPVIITSIPTEIDVRDVTFVKGGRVRKCIVLTFYKDDIFIKNLNVIQSNNNVMIMLSRIEGGKLDHVLPDEAVQMLQDCQTMNKLKLNIPSEEEEMMVAERYRMAGSMKHARFGEPDNMDDIMSLNMRQEGMEASTYQAFSNEDINTSLISSINRKAAGIVDEPTSIERIVRGMDITPLVEERNRRQTEEKK